MGTLHTPDRMSGILIPDDRLELWEDETGIFDSGGTKESELGQASPIASLPAKTSTPATDLGLRATGRQSESIEVQFNRGGLPVLDVAGYCVRAADGDPQDWMGCDLPVPLTGFQSVSGAGQRFYPHVVAVGTELSDVAAMVVYADVSGAIHSRNVSDAGAWSGESTIDSAVVAPVPQPCCGSHAPAACSVSAGLTPEPTTRSGAGSPTTMERRGRRSAPCCPPS